MADVLSTGAAWLASQLQASASETVTYSRPSTGQSVSFPATFGSQLLRVSDQRQVAKTLRTDRDFIFLTTSLVLGGVQTIPQRGDRVTISTGEVFEVDAYGNEGPWRYADPFENLIRVHTKAQTV